MKTTFLRIALLLAAMFNFLAALMFVFPTTIGKLAEMPDPGSIVYSYMLATIIGLFGAAFVWLAFQRQFDRPLLTVGAVGKIGVFLVCLYCWQVGAITFRGFSFVFGDLAFALIFSWWLLTTRDDRTI